LTVGQNPREPFIRFIRANAQGLLDSHPRGEIPSSKELIMLLEAAWKGQTNEERAAYGGRAIISSSFGSFLFLFVISKNNFFIIEIKPARIMLADKTVLVRGYHTEPCSKTPARKTRKSGKP
jgi:hypothetical protein